MENIEFEKIFLLNQWAFALGYSLIFFLKDLKRKKNKECKGITAH